MCSSHDLIRRESLSKAPATQREVLSRPLVLHREAGGEAERGEMGRTLAATASTLMGGLRTLGTTSAPQMTFRTALPAQGATNESATVRDWSRTLAVVIDDAPPRARCFEARRLGALARTLHSLHRAPPMKMPLSELVRWSCTACRGRRCAASGAGCSEARRPVLLRGLV